jgi:hypothetical protein
VVEGRRSVRKMGWVDWAALALALVTFGVIAAVLAQNFLGLK